MPDTGHLQRQVVLMLWLISAYASFVYINIFLTYSHFAYLKNMIKQMCIYIVDLNKILVIRADQLWDLFCTHTVAGHTDKHLSALL